MVRLLNIATQVPLKGVAAPITHLGFYASMAIEAVAAAAGEKNILDDAVRTLITRLKSLALSGSSNGGISFDIVAAVQAITCSVCAVARLEDEPLAEIVHHLVHLVLTVDMEESSLDCLAAIIELQHIANRPHSGNAALENALALLCTPSTCEALLVWWVNSVAGEENRNRHALGGLLLAGVVKCAYASEAVEGANVDRGIQVAAEHFVMEMALAEMLGDHIEQCFALLSAFLAVGAQMMPYLRSSPMWATFTLCASMLN